MITGEIDLRTPEGRQGLTWERLRQGDRKARALLLIFDSDVYLPDGKPLFGRGGDYLLEDPKGTYKLVTAGELLAGWEVLND